MENSMNKKLFLLLTLASVASVIQAKPYTITAEDKACTNKAEGYVELASCFNKIGDRAADYIEAEIKAKRPELYKQYFKQGTKISKSCDKKYLGDGSQFAQAESSQCYMDRMIALSAKYDKILNHR